MSEGMIGMDYLALIAPIALIAVTALVVRRLARSLEHEWHHHDRLWHGRVLMRRRRPDGTWEYRPMTAAEEDEDREMRAW